MKHSLHIFTTKEAYLVVGMCMFLGLFVGLSLQGFQDPSETTTGWENFSVLMGELFILVPGFLILKQRKIAVKSIIPLRVVPPLSYLMSAILVAGVLGLISVFEALVIPYFPIPDFLKHFESDLAQGSALDTIILLVAATLAAPVAEEILFRGVLQHSLFYRFGSLIPAMVIPSLLFAMIHFAYLFYFPAVVELLILALVLAWLMVKTGNIFVPILAHALFNLSSFLSIFSIEPDEMTSLADLGLTWIIVSTVLFMVAAYYFKMLPVARFDEVHVIPPLAHPKDYND